MNSPATLLTQVRAGLPDDLRDQFFDADTHRGIHLAVMREPFLGMLLEGAKTVESRLSVNRVDPFDRVHSGDLVLLKAGAVVGAFVVGGAECRRVTEVELAEIRRDRNHQIMADAAFWQLKQDARFVTLIGVESVRRLEPFSVSKRDMRGWVVLRAAARALVPMW
jgi:hypothetical protein